MKTKASLWIFVLLFVLACQLPGFRAPAAPTPTPIPQIAPTRVVEILPTVTPACISPEPTQADIDRALDYTGALFKSDEWERSYSVMESRVGVTWMNNSIGAVAYLEALIFSCGYEEPDVDAYFSPETWDVIFQYYDDYEIVSECRTDNGLRLYEVDATNAGFEYDIRYWARNDTDNRVITMMMTFPVGTEDLLDDYATRLFPPLPDCNN
jgi:hypothetical protein